MPGYDLIQDYGFAEDEDVDVIVQDPYAVVAVFQFRFPVTWSRKTAASYSSELAEAVRLRGPPLILVDNIRSLNVSSNKSSHLHNLEFRLSPGEINYLSEILPGDWAMAWIVNDKATANSLIKRLRQDPVPACNKWDDGFKFLGRIQNLRKNLVVQGRGTKTVAYSVSATGFKELDSMIYYDPRLATADDSDWATWFHRRGLDITKFILDRGPGQAPAMDVNSIVPVLLNLLMGKGVPKNLGLKDQHYTVTAGLDGAEGAYLVPREVVSALGRTRIGSEAAFAALGGTPPFYNYVDVFDLLYGVQKYTSTTPASGSTQTQANSTETLNQSRAQPFIPDGVLGQNTNFKFTGYKLMGEFLPMPNQFHNRPVWSILQQYRNEAVNEMFTCLRVDANGNVQPTIVFRQYPFTSDLIDIPAILKNRKAAINPDLSVPDPGYTQTTRYLEVPRWNVDDAMIKHVNVGRSNNMRTNFVHVIGDNPNLAQDGLAFQFAINTPFLDRLDISRSGLEPVIQTVNVVAPAAQISYSSSAWMAIVADMRMGEHLTLSGVMACTGIQSPICVGDNVVFEDVVFHIEGVDHAFAIEANGTKTFTTTLALSHGLSLEVDSTRELSLFPGLGSESLRGHEPGITVEGVDRNVGTEANELENRNLSSIEGPLVEKPRTLVGTKRSSRGKGLVGVKRSSRSSSR